MPYLCWVFYNVLIVYLSDLLPSISAEVFSNLNLVAFILIKNFVLLPYIHVAMNNIAFYFEYFKIHINNVPFYIFFSSCFLALKIILLRFVHIDICTYVFILLVHFKCCVLIYCSNIFHISYLFCYWWTSRLIQIFTNKIKPKFQWIIVLFCICATALLSRFYI